MRSCIPNRVSLILAPLAFTVHHHVHFTLSSLDSIQSSSKNTEPHLKPLSDPGELYLLFHFPMFLAFLPSPVCSSATHSITTLTSTNHLGETV